MLNFATQNTFLLINWDRLYFPINDVLEIRLKRVLMLFLGIFNNVINVDYFHYIRLCFY